MEETPTSNPIQRLEHQRLGGSMHSRQAPASVWGIRASSSAEATGRRLDLELVAAFT